MEIASINSLGPCLWKKAFAASGRLGREDMGGIKVKPPQPDAVARSGLADGLMREWKGAFFERSGSCWNAA
jgi:hypothetical protein